MELCSLSFIFLVLPAAIVLCRVLPRRARPLLLLALSVLLYWWAEKENTLLIAAVVAFDYGMAHLLEKCAEFPRLRRAVMVSSVAKSVALIVIYSVMNQLYGTHFPLGLGVACLTSAGYVIDCYKGFASRERNPIDFALMVSFFPKLYAGPLVSAGRLLPQIKNMRMTLQRTGEGGELFIQGLAKKVILGDIILQLYQELKAVPLYNTTVLSVWMMVVMLSFAVYFILSGYCDMAKGLGLIFGFELPVNFSHPYRSVGANDFLSRFNITVNKYMRRYVYLNLGGTQGGVLSGVFNILLVTILMALWFGIRLNVLIWGIYFGAFVILERYFLNRHTDLIPTLFRWLYSTAVILVSFIIFAGDTPRESFEYFKYMFGFGPVQGYDGKALNLLISNYLVLLVAAVCSFGLPGLMAGFIKRNAPRIWRVLSAALHVALLTVAISFML